MPDKYVFKVRNSFSESVASRNSDRTGLVGVNRADLIFKVAFLEIFRRVYLLLEDVSKILMKSHVVVLALVHLVVQ